jgi:hypothetical protein
MTLRHSALLMAGSAALLGAAPAWSCELGTVQCSSSSAYLCLATTDGQHQHYWRGISRNDLRLVDIDRRTFKYVGEAYADEAAAYDTYVEAADAVASNYACLPPAAAKP